MPVSTQVNVLSWLAEFSQVTGKGGSTDKFVKQRLEKDLHGL
jgi:hypothetical protein